MPMHQPDCDEARRRGESIGLKLFIQLEREHKLDSGFTVKDHDRWEEIRKKFVKIVGELFVEDVCNSF
jgi:hypothetical protein